MEQYTQPTQPGGAMDTPASPVKVSEESKQIRSVEAMIKQLQDTVTAQQQEIGRLRRDIARLKNDIGDIITSLRTRG